MVSSDQCVFSPGDDKGFPPPDDHLEKINGETAEVVKVIDKEQVTKKKPRFIWTRDMHNRFLDAVKQLGFHKAVPTKILELMNVEDLNRENVASHLQKYRIQVKRRAQARAQERASSSNAPQAVYPHIPQQPRALPNTMQSINMECTCLDRSRLAPSFLNPNLNLIQGASTSQEVYGTTNLLVEGVNRMRSLRLLRGCLDSNGPYDINNIGYNSGQLPPKPLVDSYAPRRLIDRHDMPLVPQFDRFYDPFAPQYDQLDESYIGSIIGPSFVPQYDQRNELYHQPSFAPQYGQHGESFVADQGIVSPSLAQNMEGFGIGGVPHTPEAAVGGLTGIVMKVGGIEPGMSHPPTGHVPLQPEETEGIAGMTYEEGQAQHLSEATGDHLPYQTEAHAGMKVEVTQVPEPTEGVGVGVPPPAEETGGLTYRNDFQQGFSFNGESSLDYNDIWLNMKEDVDGKSFDELFR